MPKWKGIDFNMWFEWEYPVPEFNDCPKMFYDNPKAIEGIEYQSLCPQEGNQTITNQIFLDNWWAYRM